MFQSDQEVAAFIEDFEAPRLSKERWTHHAHLVVGLWYLSRHSYDEALEIVRRRILAHNESVGTANTDHSGYHETLTRLYLTGIAGHREAGGTATFLETLGTLLASPHGDKEWPLRFYTRERLFSVEARRSWLEPDLEPGASTEMPCEIGRFFRSSCET